jgi:hypothetical protein
VHAQTRRLTVSYTQDGSSHEVEVEVPAIPEAASEQRADAARFVQTLVDNGNLDGPAATHRIVTRPDGTRALQALRKS